jgi:hypothetical protein
VGVADQWAHCRTRRSTYNLRNSRRIHSVEKGRGCKPIISLLYVMENGASSEIAVVGNEGIVGISLFMGGESTSSRAVVQSAGKGFRLNAQKMKEQFDRAGPWFRQTRLNMCRSRRTSFASLR